MLLPKQQTWVPSLGGEDPLEEQVATHLVLFPGKFHGQRSLRGYSPWGPKESDKTGRLSTHLTAFAQKALQTRSLHLRQASKGMQDHQRQHPCDGSEQAWDALDRKEAMEGVASQKRKHLG